MSKFDKKKPCFVLYVEDENEPLVMNGADGQPLMFSNYSKAKKHVGRTMDAAEREHVRFVN